MDIASLVDSLGGMAQKQQLVRLGARDLDLTRAVRLGDVARARQGWYTTLDPDDPRVRAVRVGGRLTGISAIQAMDGWVLGRHPLHVSVPANAARLRSVSNRFRAFDYHRRSGVVLHWDTDEVSGRGTSMIVGLAEALYRVILDEPLETAVAAVDWALSTGMLERFDLELIILRLPAGFRDFRSWTDEKCESLPESLARTRFRLRGHVVTSQIPLPDGERIDLVVDGVAAIETDGDKYHRDYFEKDRAKDLEIAIVRYHGLRPSARSVFWRWDRVYAAVLTALDERGVPRPLEIQDFPRRGRRSPASFRDPARRREQQLLNSRQNYVPSGPNAPPQRWE